MSKSTRRKYYKRRSSKWASNIQEIHQLISTPAVQDDFHYSASLITAPPQQNALATQRYTVKNLEISFNITSGNSNSLYQLDGICVYVMFVPQGYILTTDFNLQHPEYILAYKYLGSPSNDSSDSASQQYQPIRIRSRLARKLDTGDNIILFIKGTNTSTESRSFRIAGLVRWWTKAN